MFLDIGCGWETEHLSINDAIGVDRNIPKGKPRVAYPIISDAQNIPIREKSIDFINCQALLEHIPKPEKCMSDMDLVLKEKGKGFILIPINANWPRNMLKRYVKEFPFSMFSVLRLLIRIRKYWKIPGMAHIKQINLLEKDKKGKIQNY